MKQLSRKKIQDMIDLNGANINSRRSSGGSGAGGGGGVSSAWVDEHYVSKDFFARLFTINGTDENDDDVVVEPNDLETTITNIQAMVGLWTEEYLSALGQGSGGGGGGGALLTEPLASINEAGMGTPSGPNKVIAWNGSTWTYMPYTTGSGTVTSVTMTVPTGFKVSNGDSQTINNSGTFALTFGGTITKNQVLASPAAANGTPAWRALVADDIPDLSSTYVKATDLAAYTWWGRTLQTSGQTKAVYGDIENAANIKIDNDKKISWKQHGQTNYLSMLTLDTSNNFVVGESMANSGLSTYIRGRSVVFQSGTGNSGSHSATLDANGVLTVEKLVIGSITIEHDTTNGGLHIVNAGIYADKYSSALGAGSGGGGGSTSLTEPLASINEAGMSTPSSPNQVIAWDGVHWTYKPYTTGSGTVTSVTMTVPTGFKVSNGDTQTINNSGTFALTFGGTITKNQVLASPAAANGTPAWRALVADDIPTLTAAKISDITLTNGTLTIGNNSITPITDATLKNDYEWWGGKLDATTKKREGDMSSVGDIAFQTSGKNIGGVAYFDTTNHRLGIGSSPGAYKLDVNGDIRTSGNLYIGGTNRILSDSGDSAKNLLEFDGTQVTLAYGFRASNETRIYGQNISMYHGSTLKVQVTSTGLKIGDATLSWDSKNHALKIDTGFYSESFISALGAGSGGGSGMSLEQPLSGINTAGLSAPTVNGSVLVYSNNVWKYSSNTGIFATAINIAGTASAAGFRATGKDNTDVLLGGGGTSKLKTINGNSIFGDGDIAIPGGTGGLTWTDLLSASGHSIGTTSNLDNIYVSGFIKDIDVNGCELVMGHGAGTSTTSKYLALAVYDNANGIGSTSNPAQMFYYNYNNRNIYLGNTVFSTTSTNNSRGKVFITGKNVVIRSVDDSSSTARALTTVRDGGVVIGINDPTSTDARFGTTIDQMMTNTGDKLFVDGSTVFGSGVRTLSDVTPGGLMLTYWFQKVNGSDTSNWWHRLGNYTFSGTGSQQIVIELFSGSGYNGNASQNSNAKITLKHAWQAIPLAQSSVGVTCERYSATCNIEVRVNSTSYNTGEVWILVPVDYGDGFYRISGTYTSWEHNGETPITSNYANDRPTADYTSGGVTTYVPNHNNNTVGYYSGGGGGSGITMADVWSAMATPAPSTAQEQIEASHLSQALSGYASKTWVQNRGYLTSNEAVTLSTAQTISAAKIFGAGLKSYSICIETKIDGTADTNRSGEINRYGSDLRLQYHNQTGYTSGGITMCYNGGCVAIGYSSQDTSYKLKVNGTSFLNGRSIINGISSVPDSVKTKYNNAKLCVNGNTFVYGTAHAQAFDNISDMRLKTVTSYIDDLTLTVEDIARAPIFNFTWNYFEDKREHVGTSAQYWLTKLPNVVDGRGAEALSMDYSATALAAAVMTARKVMDHEERIAALEAENGNIHFGSAAQDWQTIFPHAVVADKEGFLSMDYAGIAVGAVKTVAQEVVLLKKRVAELEKQLKAS